MQPRHTYHLIILIWHSFLFSQRGKPPSRLKKAVLTVGGNTNKFRAISPQYRKLRSRALEFSMQLSNRQSRNYCDFGAAGRPLNRQLGSESKERTNGHPTSNNATTAASWVIALPRSCGWKNEHGEDKEAVRKGRRDKTYFSIDHLTKL